MPSSKKPAKPRRSRGSHVPRRHAEPPPPEPPPPTQPDPNLAARVAALEERVKQLESFADNFDSALLVEAVTAGKLGFRVRNLEERAATRPPVETSEAGAPSMMQPERAAADEETTDERPPIVLSTPSPGALDWIALGAELAERGAHRVALALRVARAAATGGRNVSIEEEGQIAAWFAGVVELALRRGREDAADAIWHIWHGDFQRDPIGRSARCPAVAIAMEAPPGDLHFVDELRAAAPGYVRTAIAGASDDEIDELRALVAADDEHLEAYRPYAAVPGARTWRGYAADPLESALAHLTRRRPTHEQITSAVAGWAYRFARLADEHTISPVRRIGAITWLARVALRDEERAA